MAESTTTEAMEEMSIVATAEAAGDFTTLLAAVEAAGLVETLEGEGPYTVFAPTDDAFAALPEGTVEGLLEDPEALGAILLYHVVPGEVTSDQVVTLESATTAQGSDLAIRVEGDSVFVNDAQVIVTDIQASNGVIHVIDAVLLPPTA
ncbi:MAG TPA: fasciclin domain-containing protein [Acidimicrobiia bacterium]